MYLLITAGLSLILHRISLGGIISQTGRSIDCLSVYWAPQTFDCLTGH